MFSNFIVNNSSADRNLPLNEYFILYHPLHWYYLILLLLRKALKFIVFYSFIKCLFYVRIKDIEAILFCIALISSC